MGLQSCIELSESFPRHYVDALRKAQDLAVGCSQAGIVAAARRYLVAVRERNVPACVRARLDDIESILAMVDDVGFDLSAAERSRVHAVLVFLANPAACIPGESQLPTDLDTGIVAELCLNELQYEIEAYEEAVTQTLQGRATRPE